MQKEAGQQRRRGYRAAFEPLDLANMKLTPFLNCPIEWASAFSPFFLNFSFIEVQLTNKIERYLKCTLWWFDRYSLFLKLVWVGCVSRATVELWLVDIRGLSLRDSVLRNRCRRNHMKSPTFDFSWLRIWQVHLVQLKHYFHFTDEGKYSVVISSVPRVAHLLDSRPGIKSRSVWF